MCVCVCVCVCVWMWVIVWVKYKGVHVCEYTPSCRPLLILYKVKYRTVQLLTLGKLKNDFSRQRCGPGSCAVGVCMRSGLTGQPPTLRPRVVCCGCMCAWQFGWTATNVAAPGRVLWVYVCVAVW